VHHRFNGTDKDSYFTKNPIKIFFCFTNPDNIIYKDGRGLEDWYVKFTHRYYLLIIFMFNMALLLINIKLWQIYATSVLLCCAAFVWTWAIAHKKTLISYQNFKEQSYNDLFCGYVLGEWHNNHHANPGAVNQKVRWWEFDIIFNIIKVIRKNA